MYLMCSISITMHIFNRTAKFSYFCHVKNLIRVEKEGGGEAKGREREREREKNLACKDRETYE